ncbi:MAG: ADP-ribosylglycohydrolase family protein [Acidobacteriota bacterium]
MSTETTAAASGGARGRYRGCLVGQLVGECLGAGLDGLTASVIRRLQDVVTEIRGGGLLGLRPGQHGSSGELMLRTAETLTTAHDVDMSAVVAAWIETGHRSLPGADETTAAALERLERGTSWRDSGRKVAESHGAGNGALGRVPPVALRFAPDRARLVQHAQEITAATHAHREAVGAGVALAVLIGTTVRGGSLDEALGDAADLCRARDDAIVAGCLRGARRRELRDLRSSGYCLHTLEAAIGCARSAGTFEEALVHAVNLGGAAAATGAITGAVAGALHGHEAVPQRWRDVVEAHGRALTVADRLFELQPKAG